MIHPRRKYRIAFVGGILLLFILGSYFYVNDILKDARRLASMAQDSHNRATIQLIHRQLEYVTKRAKQELLARADSTQSIDSLLRITMPKLLDSTLSQPPTLWLVNTRESSKEVEKELKNDLMTVWLTDSGKTIFRRGPTGNRFITAEYSPFAGDKRLRIHYLMHRNYEFPANYRKNLSKSLSEMMWLAAMFALMVSVISLSRGHSFDPDRQQFERDWEKQRNNQSKKSKGNSSD